MIKPGRSLTLAQRRRASKSLDGKIPRTPDPDNASGMNYSCLTYNEFFGPKDWEIPSDHKISKSLTTLLSIESQDSDDVDDDSRLRIIDDANLTPAEKTRKILGLTYEEVEATTVKLHKKPSTDINAVETKPSTLSVTKEAVEPRTVATQIEHSFSRSKDELAQSSRRCICCEKTICSKENDRDSNSSTSDAGSMHQIVIVASGIAGESVDIKRERPSRGKSFDCCSQNRHDERKSHEKEDDSNDLDESNSGNAKAAEILARYQLESNTVSTAFSYHTHDSCLPTSCFQAIVHRDGIVWENLKEINFVSVIKRMLYDEFKPFKLQRIYVEGKKSRENAEQTLNNILKEIDWRLRWSCEHNKDKVNRQSDHRCETIISDREDGSRFIDKFSHSSAAGKHAFSAQSSVSFGINADILALNVSHVFEKMPISGIESFDSTTISKKESPIPSQQDVSADSYLLSSFPKHSNMFHNPTTELQENLEEEIIKSATLPQDHHDHKPPAISRMSLKIQWENSDEKIYSLSLLGDESVSSGPTNPTKFNEKFPCSSKISPTMTKKKSESRINRLPEFNKPSVAVHSISDSQKLIEIDKSIVLSAPENESVAGEKSSQKGSRCRNWLDTRSPPSSLGSSKIRKSSREWEVKAIEALKAYNEKTIVKYKREMDARKQHERPKIGHRQDDSHDSRTGLLFSKQPTAISCSDRDDAEPSVSPAATRRSRANQILYVPSVPEIETPEKELTWKIDNAYARFTRSKPIDPSSLHRKCATKEFVEMYSGSGRLKSESQKVKIQDKAARKQHSKYSKSDRGGNESDVSSKSCRRIEGSQKGRDLDRTTAKANFRAQEIEVYFFERHIDDKPTTSKDVSITTIKTFLPKRGTDTSTTGSSEISIPDESRSPMVDVSTTPEEIPRRIEDEYYVQLGEKNISENVREAIKNIDWSCGWLNNNEISQRERNELNDTIVMRDRSLEQQDIVYETTEKMLQSAFAHSESSERGFHLGERTNEFYPIFNNVNLTMGEIVKAAALRGYRDEFISQPATEIEIPEIPDVDLYNLVDPLCPLERRSSSRQFLGFNLSADLGMHAVHEEQASLLSIFKGLPTPKMLPTFSKRHDSERRIGSIPRSRERVGLALRDIIHQSPDTIQGTSFRLRSFDVNGEPPFQVDVTSCQRILNHFNSGGKEMQNVIEKIFDQLPNSKMFTRSEDPNLQIRDNLDENLFGNLRGSEFITVLQMITNLQLIKNIAGKIINVSHDCRESEKTPADSTRHHSVDQNQISPEQAMTVTRISDAPKYQQLKAETSTETNDLGRAEDREEIKYGSSCQVVIGAENNPESRVSSAEKIDELFDDEGKKLLSNILETETSILPPTPSELLRRVKVLRDVESAESLIKKMNTVLEPFHVHGNSREDQIEKCETSVGIEGEVSSVTDLRFPDNSELQKLHNLMKIVVNYAMITEYSSGIFSSSEPGQSTSSGIKSSQQLNNSDVQRKDKHCTNEISGNLEEGSDTLPGIGDLQATQDPVSRSRSSQKETKHQVNRFSSWDRMIPLSTRLQLARSKRKSRARKVVAIPEPSRRVVKVDKLIAEKNLDFFSARYVPQRGRGLSSGYLMDSDSDGNLTVSRPPTPSSVGSAVSQSLSCDSEQPDVFSDPLMTPGILSSSEMTQHSHVTDVPRQICLTSASQNPIGETILSENALDLMNNLLPPNSDSRRYSCRNEMIETQQSSEMSSSLVVVEQEAPLRAESILPDVIGADGSTKNGWRDEKSHVLVTKTLPTKNELNRMSPIYATRIEDKLNDVMQQILSHQFSRVEPQTSSVTDSKIGSFISVSGPTMIDSWIDSRLNDCDPEAEIQTRNRMKEECQKKIVNILDRSDDTPIDELIGHFRGSVESTSESSGSVPFEMPVPRSRISLKHVAIGTEYNVEVFKDLLHLFKKLLTVNVHSLVQTTSESDRNTPGEGSRDAIPPFNSSDEIYLKGTSNLSRIDSSLVVIPTKDLDSAVKLLHLQSFRKEHSNTGVDEIQSHENLVKSNNIEQVKYSNFLEKLDSPGSDFHSYDSFASLSYRNITDTSELVSREISISNHTFLEEFPEQLESSINLLPESSEVVDKRSSESMKSQFDEDSAETSLKQQTSAVSSDTNGSHAALASTSSSTCDAEPKKDAVSTKSSIPRPVKNNKGSKET
ncbi:uncharacterized protein LOC124175653 [Neodiprion fabricii]|uniref:uncharacterized protein LOC124175653 n=1 Tax=Neodiprion fabricii TaxID=2872261 RepID=UPI001ED9735D|nr:uncharacterized protein LOC124175653 [Neodiprion fabricii]